MTDLYIGLFVIAFVVCSMIVVMVVESNADERREKAYLKLDREIALFYAKNKR